MTEAGDSRTGIAGAFASSGRIAPLRAVVVTAVGMGLLWAVVSLFVEGGMVAYMIGGAVVGLIIAKLCAEWARRLHDLGVRGLWGFAAAVVVLIVVFALTVSPLLQDVPWAMDAVGGVLGLAGLGVLVIPGNRGVNRFGPVPTSPFAVGGRPSAAQARRGIVFTVVAVIGCGLIGYALIALSNGMRDAQQRTRQAVEQQGTP